MLDPGRSAQAISALSLNYSRSYGKKKGGIKRHGWSKPAESFVKLNVDAGFDIDSVLCLITALEKLIELHIA